jgi:predicted dehydrogenase
MMRVMRSAIIGTGFMGIVHANAVRAARGTVVSVLGSTPERSRAGAADLGAERAALTLDELVSADDVDVVHVCTPNVLHVEQARAAIAHGKHVICEKPLATSVADAAELVRLADAAGLRTGVPFAYRFYGSVRAARDRVRTGRTGRILAVHGTYLQDWLADPDASNWRVDAARGGGSRAFGDIGVHWCDMAEFITGQRIARVAARTTRAYDRRGGLDVTTEDAVSVVFETDGGALGSVIASQVSLGRKNRLWISVDGASEAVGFDQESEEQLWIGRADESAVIMRGGTPNGPGVDRYNHVPAGHPQGYQECFNDFVADMYAAVSGDEPDGMPTFRDGLRAAVVTDAVMRAAAEEAWVEVPA